GLLSFLTSGVLSWRGKFALLTERFRRPRPDLADESIDAFARRRTNDEGADTLADAFVTGIHAGDPALLSLRATFPRFAELEREHGSLSRGMSAAAKKRRAEAPAPLTPNPSPPGGEGRVRGGTQMWSFREGLGLLIESLCRRLR